MNGGAKEENPPRPLLWPKELPLRLLRAVPLKHARGTHHSALDEALETLGAVREAVEREGDELAQSVAQERDQHGPEAALLTCKQTKTQQRVPSRRGRAVLRGVRTTTRPGKERNPKLPLLISAAFGRAPSRKASERSKGQIKEASPLTVVQNEVEDVVQSVADEVVHRVHVVDPIVNGRAALKEPLGLSLGREVAPLLPPSLGDADQQRHSTPTTNTAGTTLVSVHHKIPVQLRHP